MGVGGTFDYLAGRVPRAPRWLRRLGLEWAFRLVAQPARGWRLVLIEGGGVTVSRFLAAGCLDILHLCVAPVIIGSGRDALCLPAIARMDEAIRLAPEVLPLGEDWLFLCRLRRVPLALRQPQEIEMADPQAGSPGRDTLEPLRFP